MNPAYDCHDRVAVVTGAGMGLATAQAFAESGAVVVLADSNEQTLRTATAALVERAVATFGRLDFAFNNAGIQAPPADAADDAPEGHDPAAGDIGYWAPDGDLVFYYDSDAPFFNGIVQIGEFDGEMDAIERQSRNFSVTIERAE
jgi:NAD(P)-dependent dehydrogenase (short-subunit alcohol dehydrogenase family)